MVEIITGASKVSAINIPIEFWLIAISFFTGILLGSIYLLYFRKKKE